MLTPILPNILTINGGSSSLKFALFRPGVPPARRLSGAVERIGPGNASLRVVEADGGRDGPRPVRAEDHGEAADAVVAEIGRRDLGAIGAIGHRVVHGGPGLVEPQGITPEVLEELRRISPFDPEHLPAEIRMIEAFAGRFPGVPQFACFDTAFHRDLPRVARLLPIPRRFDAVGVRRYGFHGLSHTFLMEELARVAGDAAARGRVILAHLGNGASLAAVKEGRPIDTTMGFTPTAGLVMGTRSGDLDPGLVGYLARAEGMSAEAFHDMVNRRSGLLGVSEISSDVRDLLARQREDPRAAEAVDLFYYQGRKWVGALAAALGGLDTLVFSGGIGENSAEVRARIADGLGFLGLELDPTRNADNGPVISAESSRVAARVIRTDEEVVIAGAVQRLTGAGPAESS